MKYYCKNCYSVMNGQRVDASRGCPHCGNELKVIHTYETVAEWEKRKGRKYPDTAPVYFTHKERNAEWLAERYLFLKDCAWLHVLVATEAGAPPDDWRPEWK